MVRSADAMADAFMRTSLLRAMASMALRCGPRRRKVFECNTRTADLTGCRARKGLPERDLLWNRRGQRLTRSLTQCGRGPNRITAAPVRQMLAPIISQ